MYKAFIYDDIFLEWKKGLQKRKNNLKVDMGNIFQADLWNIAHDKSGHTTKRKNMSKHEAYPNKMIFKENSYEPNLIGIMVRVFNNGLGDWGSITGWVILKTQKIVLDTSLTFNIIGYGSRVSGAIQKKGVVPSPTSRCRRYWKEAFGLPATTDIWIDSKYWRN